MTYPAEPFIIAPVTASSAISSHLTSYSRETRSSTLSIFTSHRKWCLPTAGRECLLVLTMLSLGKVDSEELKELKLYFISVFSLYICGIFRVKTKSPGYRRWISHCQGFLVYRPYSTPMPWWEDVRSGTMFIRRTNSLSENHCPGGGLEWTIAWKNASCF